MVDKRRRFRKEQHEFTYEIEYKGKAKRYEN